jgi:subtilisin family serine protease
MSERPSAPQRTEIVEAPIQLDEPQPLPPLPEVSALIRVRQARDTFEVDGSGLSVAVMDTGLRTTHVDFAGRVRTQRSFTGDNNGNPNDASDGNGHGTNVTGIIAANADHVGIAPGAGVIPLKVLSNSGGGSFEGIADALQWVIDHRVEFDISAVCMSLGDGGNYTSDDFEGDPLRGKLQTLRDNRVAVVIAAGNDYFTHGSQQGMGYPGILRASVSVGAVYDAVEGGFQYRSGAEAFSTAPDRITPFSQRLHESVNPNTRTEILAPGAPVTSSGINNDHGESVQHGTSQATPVTVGVILLMQHFLLRTTGELPSVDDLETWLRNGGVRILDGDDEQDNVEHTNLEFIRLDAFGGLDAVRRHLLTRMLATGTALR